MELLQIVVIEESDLIDYFTVTWMHKKQTKNGNAK